MSFRHRPGTKKHEAVENKKTAEPPHKLSEIESDASEERIVNVACNATEKISSESVFKFEMTNDGFDGLSAFEEAVIFLGEIFSSRDKNRNMFWPMNGSAIALVDKDRFHRLACVGFDIGDGLFER